jgi:hypothetical protein
MITYLCQNIYTTEDVELVIVSNIAEALAAKDFIGTNVDLYASDGLVMADVKTTHSDSQKEVRISLSLCINNYLDIKAFVFNGSTLEKRCEDICNAASLVAGYKSIIE